MQLTPISSTDIEPLFSVFDVICSNLRGCLSPDRVNMLASLNFWIIGYVRVEEYSLIEELFIGDSIIHFKFLSGIDVTGKRT